jgi:hypothetical protein
MADLELGRDLILQQRFVSPQLAAGNRFSQHGGNQLMGRLLLHPGHPAKDLLELHALAYIMKEPASLAG